MTIKTEEQLLQQEVELGDEAMENRSGSDHQEDEASNPVPPENVQGGGDGEEDEEEEEEENEFEAERIRHWKESPFAVGLVDISWKRSDSSLRQPQQHRYRRASRAKDLPINGFCNLLGAGRVGNMVVFRQYQDDTSTVPKLVCLMGPYWPMMIFVTIPLIAGLSAATAVFKLPDVALGWQIVWSVVTVSVFVSLCCVSCRNPGILPRYSEIPDTVVDETTWVWNDQARTFRPPKAKYDPECAVVVEEFDHTCPWTGTAIGKSNMMAFRFFVPLIFVDIFMNAIMLSFPFFIN